MRPPGHNSTDLPALQTVRAARGNKKRPERCRTAAFRACCFAKNEDQAEPFGSFLARRANMTVKAVPAAIQEAM